MLRFRLRKLLPLEQSCRQGRPRRPLAAPLSPHQQRLVRAPRQQTLLHRSDHRVRRTEFSIRSDAVCSRRRLSVAHRDLHHYKQRRYAQSLRRGNEDRLDLALKVLTPPTPWTDAAKPRLQFGSKKIANGHRRLKKKKRHRLTVQKRRRDAKRRPALLIFVHCCQPRSSQKLKKKKQQQQQRQTLRHREPTRPARFTVAVAI